MGGLISCNDLAHTEELIRQISANSGKPSYSYGYSSTASNLTWLEHGPKVPSNKTGIPFGLNNGQLTFLWIGNSELVAYNISVYWHDGDEVNLTLLKTVTVPNTARTKTFDVTALGTIIVPKDKQIACRVTDVPGSNPRNIGLHATIIGTN